MTQGCSSYIDEVMLKMNINVHSQGPTPALNWTLLDAYVSMIATLNFTKLKGSGEGLTSTLQILPWGED